MPDSANPAAFRPALLVVDGDQDFMRTLLDDPQAKNTPVLCAPSGWEAQLMLSDEDKLYCGIFVSPMLGAPGWHSVVKSAMQHRPSVPIFLLVESGTNELPQPEELKRAGIRKVITKPVELRALIEVADPMKVSFDVQAALAKAKLNKDIVGLEAQAADSDFVPIRASGFLSGSQSFFDVYVRLGTQKYVKLLQAGDSFASDRIENYIKKGVVNLYIRKEAHESYIGYADTLASALLRSSTTPTAASSAAVQLQTKQILVQGEETLKFLSTQGISDSNIKYGARFVRNVHQLVKQIDTDDGGDWLKGFFSNLSLYDHAAGTTMLAGILAQTLEIQMDKPAQIIGMAGLFHHVGLSQMPENLWNEDESKFTVEEKHLFRTHPTCAVELLRGKPGIDSATIQAIEQHHMRPGGRGFPEKMNSAPLHPIGQMIGICSEFNHHIRAGKSPPEILSLLEENVFPLFSKQVVYGFRTAFYPQ